VVDFVLAAQRATMTTTGTGDLRSQVAAKTWWLADDRIPAAARAHADLPTDLDPAGAAAVHAAVVKLDGGGWYEGRSCARAGHLRTGIRTMIKVWPPTIAASGLTSSALELLPCRAWRR
jgi:hypothetical protein